VVERERQTGEGNVLHSRKVAGLIPDGIIGNFPSHNPSGRCVELTTLPPSYADCLEIWEFQSLEPSGSGKACNGITFSRADTEFSSGNLFGCYVYVYDPTVIIVVLARRI